MPQFSQASNHIKEAFLSFAGMSNLSNPQVMLKVGKRMEKIIEDVFDKCEEQQKEYATEQAKVIGEEEGGEDDQEDMDAIDQPEDDVPMNDEEIKEREPYIKKEDAENQRQVDTMMLNSDAVDGQLPVADEDDIKKE